MNAAKYLNYATKLGLFGAFFVALFVDLDVLEGKAMTLRAPLFLAPAFIVPILARVRGWRDYPYTAETLLVLVPLLDTSGNLTGLYDSVANFDGYIHFVNTVILIMSFQAFRKDTNLGRADAILIATGVGALLTTSWELFEWVISPDGIGPADGLNLTYGDTISDLFLSTSGGFIGAVLGYMVFIKSD